MNAVEMFGLADLCLSQMYHNNQINPSSKELKFVQIELVQTFPTVRDKSKSLS